MSVPESACPVSGTNVYGLLWMLNHHDSRKWYQRKRWIIGSLLLFPPLGIPLLWLTRWPRASKIGGSIVSGIILLSALAGEPEEPTVTNIEPPTPETVEAQPDVVPVVTAAYESAIAEATVAAEALSSAESATDWVQIANQWETAISHLRDIPTNSDDYGQAQMKIAEYERNYDYAIAQKTAVEEAEAEAIARQQAEEERALARQQAEEQVAQAALPAVEPQGGYVSGTCKELRERGIGSNFRPGDPNYTSRRDGDNDGIACES